MRGRASGAPSAPASTVSGPGESALFSRSSQSTAEGLRYGRAREASRSAPASCSRIRSRRRDRPIPRSVLTGPEISADARIRRRREARARPAQQRVQPDPHGQRDARRQQQHAYRQRPCRGIGHRLAGLGAPERGIGGAGGGTGYQPRGQCAERRAGRTRRSPASCTSPRSISGSGARSRSRPRPDAIILDQRTSALRDAGTLILCAAAAAPVGYGGLRSVRPGRRRPRARRRVPVPSRREIDL